MNRTPDAEVILRLLPTTDGGKANPVLSGYRPHYAIHSDYLTSVNHELLDDLAIHPGGQGRVNVWFITPEQYPNTLWIGREIAVSEGSKVVGSALVVSVFNATLLGDSPPTTTLG